MRSATVLAVMMSMSLALPSFAEKPASAGVGVEGPARAQIRERVQGKIHTWLTTELSTRLSLDAKKSAQLSDALKVHMQRKQERQQKLREEMLKLRSLVDGKASDSQVKSQLDVVIGASSRDDDAHALLRDTAKFLSVQEQAKLALAMPELLKDMRKMMRDVRREMRGKRGGFGGGFGGKGERAELRAGAADDDDDDDEL